ncbi:hypothetical protein BDN70DRAFT_873935 [Pholiota conissans]|uniref:F-box domain-containing protein n=1 Tax=Pholiota conissans TaxID=109636 RepID=A0A9P6CWX4_9AGAR|nr:hypothetical protein BDN70DRAFT_873935 [Pholiota conissans]
MSPPFRTRQRRQGHTFAHSLSTFLSTFSCSLFTKPQIVTPPLHHDQHHDFSPINRRRAIGRPRQLRRNVPIYRNDFYIHPINEIPVEILCLIFESGTEADVFFPITISHVCREWRQIALHMPSLWRRIELGHEDRMWRERIRRAQGCPLDIQLLPSRQTRFGRRSQDLNPYTVNWHMHIVQPYIQQWRSLHIHFAEYSSYLWKAALAACTTAAHTLEELSLIYRHNDDIQEFLLFDGYAPRLRRVTVDGIRLLWTPSLFANLTYLDYTHHGFTSGYEAVQDVIYLLSVSSRLIELRVHFPRGQIARLSSRHDSVTNHVTLPHLRVLHLTSNGSDIPFELAHFVTLVSTPSLMTLRLVDLARSHHSFPSLKSFFYVYALPPTLRFICIGHGWYNPRMIQAMARSLPRLVRIHVKRPRSPEHVVNLKPQIREIPSFGSTRKSHVLVRTTDRFYCVDRLDIQYFPGYTA